MLDRAITIVWAAITKCHRLGGLNNKNLTCHSFGDWKSHVWMPAWLVSGERPLTGLHMAAFSLCLLVVRTDSKTVSMSLQSLLIKDTNSIGLGPHSHHLN